MKEDRIELRRGTGRRPKLCPVGKGRRFTVAKQEIFFAELAATCNVRASCRKARVSHTCVYEQRRKSGQFRARWAEVLREAYARLEMMMIERMMNGTVKTITRSDGSVDKIHEYPNAVALQLLRLHRQTVAEAEEEHDPEDVEEVRERLANKVERLRKRIEREAERQGGAGGKGEGGGEGGEKGDTDAKGDSHE